MTRDHISRGCHGACRRNRRPVHAPGGAVRRSARAARQGRARLAGRCRAAARQRRFARCRLRAGLGGACLCGVALRTRRGPRCHARRCWIRRGPAAAKAGARQRRMAPGRRLRAALRGRSRSTSSAAASRSTTWSSRRARSPRWCAWRGPGGRIVLCDAVASDDPVKAAAFNAMERFRDPSTVEFRTLGFPARAVCRWRGWPHPRSASTTCRWSAIR